MAGTLTIDTLKASTGVLATQNGMSGIAKAWVQWAGSTGTIANSFNVSSVTRSTTGQYLVNFTTAMPSGSYGVGGFGKRSGGTPYPDSIVGGYPVSTSQLAVYTSNGGGSYEDFSNVSVAVFA